MIYLFTCFIGLFLTVHSDLWITKSSKSKALLDFLFSLPPQMYQINQTHGLLKKINSVIQKITEPIQPKVAEHKPQTVKRLSYPFSREKQHLWVKAFPKCPCPQVPASLSSSGTRGWKHEHQHFGGHCCKEYFHFEVNLLLGGFFFGLLLRNESLQRNLCVFYPLLRHIVCIWITIHFC